jgi:hypothetical protein
MRKPISVATLTAIVATAAAGGCRDHTPTGPDMIVPNAADATRATSIPLPAPSQFVAVIDNPYYPLIPGTTLEYRSETSEGTETNTVEVTHETKTILGITATVVHDQVFLEGELTEDTYDWYAQDVTGNVWYLGEASCEVEDGECVSIEGSWEAGVDGAMAGIVMWADPAAHQGETYRQEFLAGEAEDVAKVIGTNASVEVPYGEFTRCIETMDFSPLELGVREHKFYCPGTGLVLEVTSREGRVRNELVDIKRL